MRDKEVYVPWGMPEDKVNHALESGTLKKRAKVVYDTQRMYKWWCGLWANKDAHFCTIFIAHYKLPEDDKGADLDGERRQLDGMTRKEMMYETRHYKSKMIIPKLDHGIELEMHERYCEPPEHHKRAMCVLHSHFGAMNTSQIFHDEIPYEGRSMKEISKLVKKKKRRKVKKKWKKKELLAGGPEL